MLVFENNLISIFSSGGLMKKLAAMVFFTMFAGSAMAQGTASTGATVGTGGSAAAGATAGVVATVGAGVVGVAAATSNNRTATTH